MVNPPCLFSEKNKKKNYAQREELDVTYLLSPSLDQTHIQRVVFSRLWGYRELVFQPGGWKHRVARGSGYRLVVSTPPPASRADLMALSPPTPLPSLKEGLMVCAILFPQFQVSALALRLC